MILAVLLSALIAVILQNNSDLKSIRDELEDMVLTDPLTGLFNRKGLFQKLDILRGEGSGFQLHFIDLNYFKQINDTHGHKVGDAVLIEFTRRMRTHLDENWFFARISGDEFVLLHRGAPMPAAADRAFWEGVEKDFRTPIHKRDGVNLVLSFSRGTASHPEDRGDLDELLNRADMRMYEEKNARYRREKRRRHDDGDHLAPPAMEGKICGPFRARRCRST